MKFEGLMEEFEPLSLMVDPLEFVDDVFNAD
jgi:hypothetical protein